MLYCRNRGNRDSRRGLAATELALLTPVLVFVLMAATDFARLYNAFLTIGSCAHNGALYGCLNTANSINTSGIQSAALTDTGNLSLTSSNISSSTANDSNSNPYVSVTATYTFTTLINYPGIPHTMPLSRTVQMRVAQNTPTS